MWYFFNNVSSSGGSKPVDIVAFDVSEPVTMSYNSRGGGLKDTTYQQKEEMQFLNNVLEREREREREGGREGGRETEGNSERRGERRKRGRMRRDREQKETDIAREND